MADRSQEARARAEATFKKKALQRQEADQVWAERATAAAASDQNAARLKELRLAKQAADTPQHKAKDELKAGRTRRSIVAKATVKKPKKAKPAKDNLP